MDLSKFEEAKDYVNRGIFPGAKHIMEQDGTHYPVAFVFATQMRGRTLSEPEVIGIPFGTGDFTEGQKEAYSNVVRAVVRETRAVGVVFISEAWWSDVSLDSAEVQERPSQAPNRQEVVFVSFEHRDGTAIWKAPIARWGDGASLGTFESVKMDLGDGRFTNLLGKLRPPEAEA